MKTHFIRLVVLLVFGLIVSEAKCQETLNFYNNTSEKLWACYATYDNTHQCWTTHGWYVVEPYQEKIVHLGNYHGKAYVHGHREGFWTVNNWGSGYSLCIDPHNAFEIRFADTAHCENKAGFSEITIKTGRNDYTFNP
jgi:uncharacterized membrane protein